MDPGPVWGDQKGSFDVVERIDLEPLREAMRELERVAGSPEAGEQRWSAYYTWRGVQPASGRAFSLPWPHYGSKMDALWHGFEAAGFRGEPADYIGWLNARLAPRDLEAIASYSAGDLEMLLLSIRRGERFCDGHWVEILKEGVFLAAGQRWIEVIEDC